MNIGELIQKRRKQIGMTQKELARGICVQATISKIELNKLMPSNTLLKKLADRLEVSISYFFGGKTTSANDNEVKNLINEVRLTLNQTENKKVLKLLQQNQALIDSLYDVDHINYFNMIKAYLDYYLFDKREQAIRHLNTILENQQINKYLKIDILSILGIIHYEEKKADKADKHFENAINLFDDLTPIQTKSRILLNYALNLEDLGQDRKSMNIVLEGIESLLENQSMYSLGYFYSHKAYLFNKFGDLGEAIKAYETAEFFFDILNYSKMHAFVKMNLSELRQKRKENVREKSD